MSDAAALESSEVWHREERFIGYITELCPHLPQDRLRGKLYYAHTSSLKHRFRLWKDADILMGSEGDEDRLEIDIYYPYSYYHNFIIPRGKKLADVVDKKTLKGLRQRLKAVELK